MRDLLARAGAIGLAVVILTACAQPLFKRTEQMLSYGEAPAKGASYRKIAVLAVKTGGSQTDPQAEDLLLQTLTAAIRSRSDRLTLMTPRDSGYPAFMKIYHPLLRRDLFSAAQTARRQGFHNLLQASLENIQASEERSGWWWFRKTRQYLTVVISLDLFDSFTGAKLIGEVMERTEKVEPDVFAAVAAGSAYATPVVQALITQMSRDLGHRAASAMLRSKWIASVTEVRNSEILLSPGSAAGLRVGDRLSLYEGRRIIAGLDEDKYIVPGYKVGEVQITSVEAEGARAALTSPADIRTGDVALPAL